MNEKQVVMDLDRQFCDDCKTGKEQAWASYFAKDGLMVTDGKRDNIIGQEAIEKAMAGLFALPDLIFTWEPVQCEVSEDGTLAVTRGTSFRSFTKNGETIEGYGNYTTIWKKVNNTWKIAWDIGN